MGNIRKFIEYIYEAEISDGGPPLWIVVNYKNGGDSYDGWPPVSASSITDKGLIDPGFGSGPVLYSDLSKVFVHSRPKIVDFSSQYENKYNRLIEKAKGMDGVGLMSGGICFVKNSSW